MKIGFIQFSPIFGNLNLTIQKLNVLIDQAKEADLLVLPELCNSGYAFESYKQAASLSEKINSSIYIDFLYSKSKKYDLHIVSGFCEKGDDCLYNSSILVGPGGYMGVYRKTHLFLDEQDYFQPGDTGFKVYDIGLCKIGMLICFDWVFPETWRILSLKGADVICHPSNIVLPELCQKTIPAHSICNRVFIVTANRIGTERELTFTGKSLISDPRGNILKQASQEEETIGISEIDLITAKNKSITERNNLFGDRRPDQYVELLS